MPSKTVPLVSGEYYHIYNRGVDKRVIFSCKQDYLRFYQSLLFFNCTSPTVNFEEAKRHIEQKQPLVEIHAYCLLPNHFHLIIKQLQDGGISEYMKRVGGGYSKYFNQTNNRSGALFQGGFKRVLIDSDAYLNYLTAYVNENHTVHNLKKPTEIIYSSSLHYEGKVQSKLLSCIAETDYDSYQASQLARDIYKKRHSMPETYQLET